MSSAKCPGLKVSFLIQLLYLYFPWHFDRLQPETADLAETVRVYTQIRFISVTLVVFTCYGLRAGSRYQGRGQIIASHSI